MLAELPNGRVDGAVQVAHAFTTHNTEPEVDFFTAVDDVAELAADAGSGHMNTAEFSAGVFYRYASINIAELLENLDGDRDQARELVEAFCTALIESLPEAKKNSTAPFTIPDLVYVAVRNDRPVSLASAFEQPVRPAPDSGCSAPSRQVFAEYTEQGVPADRHRRPGPPRVRGDRREEKRRARISGHSFRDLVAGCVESRSGRTRHRDRPAPAACRPPPVLGRTQHVRHPRHPSSPDTSGLIGMFAAAQGRPRRRRVDDMRALELPSGSTGRASSRRLPYGRRRPVSCSYGFPPPRENAGPKIRPRSCPAATTSPTPASRWRSRRTRPADLYYRRGIADADLDAVPGASLLSARHSARSCSPTMPVIRFASWRAFR